MEGVAIDLDAVETNIVIFRLTGGREREGAGGAAEGARNSDQRLRAGCDSAGDAS